MDSVIVFAIGLAAVLYIVMKVYKSATSSGGCGCGCDGSKKSQSGCGCGCGGQDDRNRS